MFLHTLGDSIMMGSFFYYVLDKMQSMGILATLIFVERIIPLVIGTYVNSRYSDKLSKVEDQKKLIRVMDSKVPFLDLWWKYHTMDSLIEQNKRTILIKNLNSTLFFGIYLTLLLGIPEIGPFWKNAALGAYAVSLAMECGAQIGEDKNSFAMTKDIFDETKYESRWWKIYSAYQNRITLLEIIPFLLSAGICKLADQDAAALFLTAGGFLLSLSNRIFSKYAQERSGVFLRGGYNIISDDQMVLNNKDNEFRARMVDPKHKLKLIKKDKRIFLPEIDPSKVRIGVKEEPKLVSVRNHWLSWLLSFGMIKKRTLAVKSGNEQIEFTLIGDKKQNLAALFELISPPSDTPAGIPPKENIPDPAGLSNK